MSKTKEKVKEEEVKCEPKKKEVNSKKEDSKKAMKQLINEGEEIKCRDGNTYIFPAFKLVDCFKFIELLETGITLDHQIFNFINTETRDKMIEMLLLAFHQNYPDMTEENLIEIVDLKDVEKIVKSCICLNDLDLGTGEKK